MFYYTYIYQYLLSQLYVILYVIPVVLFAVVCHEYAHGWMSDRLGEPTPRAYGRLSLNPFRHLDFWGTVCLLFFHIGWAKPVPINFSYSDFKPCRNYLQWNVAWNRAVTEYLQNLWLTCGDIDGKNGMVYQKKSRKTQSF